MAWSIAVNRRFLNFADRPECFAPFPPFCPFLTKYCFSLPEKPRRAASSAKTAGGLAASIAAWQPTLRKPPMSSSASDSAHAARFALLAWAAARFGRGAAAATAPGCAVPAAAAAAHAGPFGQCCLQKPHQGPAGGPSLQIFVPVVHGTASPSVGFLKVHLSGRPRQEQFRLPYPGFMCGLPAAARSAAATVNACDSDDERATESSQMFEFYRRSTCTADEGHLTGTNITAVQFTGLRTEVYWLSIIEPCPYYLLYTFLQ